MAYRIDLIVFSPRNFRMCSGNLQSFLALAVACRFPKNNRNLGWIKIGSIFELQLGDQNSMRQNSFVQDKF